jgi:hypothetical protein
MNVYEKLDEWLKNEYPEFNTWVYFNAEKHQKNNNAMMSDNDVVTEHFIDGTKRVTVPFQIEMIRSHDFEQSELNMEHMESAMDFIDWMQKQEYESNYPILGEDICVEELVVDSEIPEVLVSTVEKLAKYVVNCKIIYTKG